MIRNFIVSTLILLIDLLPIQVYSQYPYGVITSKFDSTGLKLWEEYGSGTYAVNLINNICSDVNSNVYIIGEVLLNIKFDKVSLPMGQFIVKYDPLCNLLWAKSIHGGTMSVHGIVTDSFENSYVLGRFSTYIESGNVELNSQSEWDVFVSKFNKEGEVIWIKSALKYNYWVELGDIAINESLNYIYITGSEDSSYPNSNLSKLFVAKFDKLNCNLIKKVTIAKRTGTPYVYKNAGYGIKNKDSYIYVTGSLKNNAGYSDIYLLKLDNSLNIIWEKQFGNNDENIGYDITLDDDKNIYVTGTFSKSVTFNNYTIKAQDRADLFIAKFNNNGNVIWVKSAGSNINNFRGEDFGYSICDDRHNSIYLSGYVGSNAKFSTLLSTTNEGPFIAKYDKTGNIRYVKSFYTGYNKDYLRGTGYVVCDMKSNSFFATNFLKSIVIGNNLVDDVSDNVPIDEKYMNLVLKIYPNPNFGIFNVEYLSNINEWQNIRIYDYCGKIVYSAKRKFENGTNIFSLNLNFLTSGLYNMFITHDNFISNKKFILIK